MSSDREIEVEQTAVSYTVTAKNGFKKAGKEGQLQDTVNDFNAKYMNHGVRAKLIVGGGDNGMDTLLVKAKREFGGDGEGREAESAKDATDNIARTMLRLIIAVDNAKHDDSVNDNDKKTLPQPNTIFKADGMLKA